MGKIKRKAILTPTPLLRQPWRSGEKGGSAATPFRKSVGWRCATTPHLVIVVV